MKGLTFFGHALRLRTLNTFIFRPAKTGRINGDPRMWVALELNHVILAGYLTPKFVWKQKHIHGVQRKDEDEEKPLHREKKSKLHHDFLTASNFFLIGSQHFWRFTTPQSSKNWEFSNLIKNNRVRSSRLQL